MDVGHRKVIVYYFLKDLLKYFFQLLTTEVACSMYQSGARVYVSNVCKTSIDAFFALLRLVH